MSEARPNILLVMADQLGTHGVPAYGNALIDAPSLEALGEEGVVFDSAYSNAPLCTPSRSSMMTGQLPSRTGVFDNGAELPSSVPTLAYYLRVRGYRTCLAGKMHFIGADQLHGFEERITTDVNPASLDWTPDWDRSVADRLPWYHDMSSVLEAGPSEATLQLDFDEEVAFRTVRKIYDLARSDDDRPFFLLASFTHPHDPYEVPSAYWERYDGITVDPPTVPPIAEADLDPHSRRLRVMCETDPLKLTEEMIRTARRAYYAAVSYVDDKLGQLLDALDASGLRDNTIVIVTADHGEMLGERGLWYKMSFFEPSARVPLIVHAPRRFTPRRVRQNVSLVDLLPTLMELVGDGHAFEPVDPIDGTSLMALLHGESVDVPDTVIGEYLAEGVVAPLVMIRRGRHKFIRCPGDPDQLYDLVSDPHELVNLSTSPDHAEILHAFREETAVRWDLEGLRRDVVASQRRRQLAAHALSIGEHTGWEYHPPEDSSGRYVRGQDFWEPFPAARLRRSVPDPTIRKPP